MNDFLKAWKALGWRDGLVSAFAALAVVFGFCWWWAIKANIAMLENKLQKAKRELAEAENSCWAPSLYDEYFFVTEGGLADNDSWNNYLADQRRLDYGNVFRTPEQAEGQARYDKLMRKLRKLAAASGELGYSWFEIGNSNGTWAVKPSYTYFSGSVQFATENAARLAIDEIGVDNLKFLEDWR